MTKLRLNLLKKLKTPIFASLGLAIVTTIVATGFSTAYAWGPERPTYTNAAPADYATFNSITDNVAVGDERNFVRIREAGTTDTYVDQLEVVPGHEYEVYIYYHNNAASDTNTSGYGVATNVRVASAYPAVVNTTERGMVSGIITWNYVTPSDPDNAKEGTVWDEAYVTSKTDGVVLKYKTGTAIIHNGGEANGSVLPTSLFTEGGTPIGYNKLSGTLPGCAEYSGHITYTLVAENPGSTLDKKVSVDGENWFDSVTVKPGDYVTYKVAFENTGNADFTNLILTDQHDTDLILRSGSTKIYDYLHTDGYDIDDIIDISGFNTGNILAGGLVQATYQMQVRSDTAKCGQLLTNSIIAGYNSTEQKTDSATVKVLCEEEPTEEDCKTNPNLPGCIVTPVTPTEEECKANPNLEGCKLPESIVNTGPLEIAMAAVVVIAIGGAGFYLWRTKHTLKAVESVVTGPNDQAPIVPTTTSSDAPASPVAPDTTTSTTTSTGQAPIDSTQSKAPVAPAGFSQSVAQPPVGPVQEPPVGTSDNSSKPEGN